MQTLLKCETSESFRGEAIEYFQFQGFLCHSQERKKKRQGKKKKEKKKKQRKEKITKQQKKKKKDRKGEKRKEKRRKQTKKIRKNIVFYFITVLYMPRCQVELLQHTQLAAKRAA